MVATRQQLITITQAEAEESDRRIQVAAETVGRELLRLKETFGWMLLKDGTGQGYANWTDFLSRRYAFTRKHLYELMDAAPVQERLSPMGYTLNTSQAKALSVYPIELHIPIVVATQNRYGRLTEARLKQVAEVLTQAVITGHVSTGDGSQTTPIDAAISLEEHEARQSRRVYITPPGAVSSIRLVGRQVLYLWEIPLDTACEVALKQGLPVRVSVWVEDQSSTR
ncbi:MAG TPA: hypothetical protein VHO69_03470 [Phototrophicaceae bacterium]|nr:hypothetical protein [Phototrophicaceae bacterium]